MVKATVDWLVERYGASVRQEMVREEHVHFPLPKPLREIAKAANGNPAAGDL
jgi:4-hydroxy-3-methylbut-2-enyl diphosphate reductase